MAGTPPTPTSFSSSSSLSSSKGLKKQLNIKQLKIMAPVTTKDDLHPYDRICAKINLALTCIVIRIRWNLAKLLPKCENTYQPFHQWGKHKCSKTGATHLSIFIYIMYEHKSYFIYQCQNWHMLLSTLYSCSYLN
jgi:hypothetical protein